MAVPLSSIHIRAAERPDTILFAALNLYPSVFDFMSCIVAIVEHTVEKLKRLIGELGHGRDHHIMSTHQ
jgi:hypothetical protein